MNNRHRRVARLQAQECDRILIRGWRQALKNQYSDVEAQTFAEAIKSASERLAETLVEDNDWWEDE